MLTLAAVRPLVQLRAVRWELSQQWQCRYALFSVSLPHAGIPPYMSAVCVALGLALRRRRQQRRQLQRAGSAVAKEVDEIDEFVVDGFGSSKAASSQQPSLASSHTLGSDPLVSYIYASQLGGKMSQRSSGSAGRSQGGSSGTGVHTWEMGWADLQLQRVVGAGSFGRVYLASWGTVTVAVKVLLVPGAAGTDLAAPGAAAEALALPPSTLAELEAEAALLASLRHPCCVNFFGVTRNPPALVTEYCGRGSVAELLDRARASPAVAAELTWRRRLLIALGAADGMAYLHGHKPAPIIHRDLKSPNLLVADFGLSRVLEDSEMASSVAVTNPSVILWELLTWERPWGATNPWQISAAVLAGRRLEIPNPAALPGPGPGSPEGLAAYLSLMQRCWAQAPGDRPSFAEVVQMVRALLDAEPAEPSLEPSRST
ncbi:hypothetical protein COHA_002020 [Chlorella ohadii]|uniref:Protein kinase domain-containing protein n=1 Tax=Chlorella ohadii TaxID=2649997 RepID=A0AAD5DU64_9CHLO|nr:hypothetical protein COHA_002020 [Chlorella ohadii]